MTALASLLPLFPWMDPFQMMNPSKPEALPQMQPPPEVEKLLKSMGLPPELAMVPGFLPSSLLPGGPQSKSESSKESKSRGESAKPKEPFTLLPTTSDKSSSLSIDKHTPVKKKGISKLDTMFGIGKTDDESPGKSSIFSGKVTNILIFVQPSPNTFSSKKNNKLGTKAASAVVIAYFYRDCFDQTGKISVKSLFKANSTEY